MLNQNVPLDLPKGTECMTSSHFINILEAKQNFVHNIPAHFILEKNFFFLEIF